MKVRPATPSDAPALAALLTEMRGLSVTTDQITDSLTAIIETLDREVLIVIEDDQPLGSLVINIVHKLPKQEARIDEVIVSEKARGRGLGTLLVQAAEAWAHEHGVDVIEFTSRPSREAANHLYQKLGYQIRETNVYHKNKGDF